jgi:predicted dehydrogenase
MTRRCVLIGAGDRGTRYGDYALKHPDRLKIVAVAEPEPRRREACARKQGLGAGEVFEDWKELLGRPRSAEGAIIATQDQFHAAPALAALAAGYQVLLEKPMATSEADCLALARAAHSTGCSLNICHVLRYTNFFRIVKGLIDSGALGEIYTILHAENVSYHHMAHSYVRGNWGDSRTSSPMILAKCCHDLDLIQWFAGSKAVRVSSFGNLSRFRSEKAPEGAPGRCTDGCPAAKSCLYEATETYLSGLPMKRALSQASELPVALAARVMLTAPRLAAHLPGLRRYAVWKEWPTSTITEDLSREGIMEALREGPYGRCVYRCGNDQVDHQETLIEFESGLTATLRMQGHSHEEGRTLRIDGSRATLRGAFGSHGELEISDKATGRRRTLPVKSSPFGHEEGDVRIMDHFVDVLNGLPTDPEEALASHILAFAADRARIEHRVVELGAAHG